MSLTREQTLALQHIWEFWAMDHQRPPESDWRHWLILGGRGAGKTRAGAEWVRSMVEGNTPMAPGRASRVALVGDTFDQAREVMIFGESGLMTISPPDRAPKWVAGRRTLVWPNGAEARVFSAQDPEMLRGPQFDAAWVDELAKWRYGSDAWDMLQFCMRLGDNPQVCITTTPRDVPVIRELASRTDTAITHATSYANAANLAPGFLDEMRTIYGGTRQGREELEGELLTDTPGAFWTRSQLASSVIAPLPEMDRIVVAVDPPAKSKTTSDECGIVVAGVVFAERRQDWRAYVLGDVSVGGASPHQWGRAAIDALHAFKADRLVAEVNQGGDMVGEILHAIDPLIPYRAVHATSSKSTRAEPIAALYEQGRVFHARGLDLLEDQMCQMNYAGYTGRGSPDRVDALVWALYELMIRPPVAQMPPRIRSL